MCLNESSESKGHKYIKVHPGKQISTNKESERLRPGENDKMKICPRKKGQAIIAEVVVSGPWTHFGLIISRVLVCLKVPILLDLDLI